MLLGIKGPSTMAEGLLTGFSFANLITSLVGTHILISSLNNTVDR